MRRHLSIVVAFLTLLLQIGAGSSLLGAQCLRPKVEAEVCPCCAERQAVAAVPVEDDNCPVTCPGCGYVRTVDTGVIPPTPATDETIDAAVAVPTIGPAIVHLGGWNAPRPPPSAPRVDASPPHLALIRTTVLMV